MALESDTDGWREWVGDGAGGFMFAICEGVAKRGLGPETTVRDWALVSLDGERSKRASLETSGVCIWRRATRSTLSQRRVRLQARAGEAKRRKREERRQRRNEWKQGMREEGKKNRNAKGNEKRKRGRMQEEWIDKEERKKKRKRNERGGLLHPPPL